MAGPEGSFQAMRYGYLDTLYMYMYSFFSLCYIFITLSLKTAGQNTAGQYTHSRSIYTLNRHGREVIWAFKEGNSFAVAPPHNDKW